MRERDFRYTDHSVRTWTMSRAPFISPLFSGASASEREREKETTAALISAFESEGYDTSVTKQFDGIEFILSRKKMKKSRNLPRAVLPDCQTSEGVQSQSTGPSAALHTDS